MKLQFLGTAAAEGIPALYCQCDTCKTARERGGREVRSRSQAIIDGKLLIDWNADTWYHSVRFGLDLSAVEALLFTHTHGDHFYPQELTACRSSDMVRIEQGARLEIYGSVDVEKELAGMVNDNKDPYGFRMNRVEPFKPFKAAGYEVTALKAEHGTEHPYNYIISKGGSTLLYAHDTAVYSDETFNYLRGSGVKFDYVSLDCTSACKYMYHAHMGLENCVIMRDKFRELGVADDKTGYCLNHFTHNGINVLYAEFSEKAAEFGFDVSYDGKMVEI